MSFLLRQPQRKGLDAGARDGPGGGIRIAPSSGSPNGCANAVSHGVAAERLGALEEPARNSATEETNTVFGLGTSSTKAAPFLGSSSSSKWSFSSTTLSSPPALLPAGSFRVSHMVPIMDADDVWQHQATCHEGTTPSSRKGQEDSPSGGPMVLFGGQSAPLATSAAPVPLSQQPPVAARSGRITVAAPEPGTFKDCMLLCKCHQRESLPLEVVPTAHKVKYIGVRMRGRNRWVAEIKDNNHNVRKWLGTFGCPVQAAQAFDAAARVIRGPHTRANFKMGDPDYVAQITDLPKEMLTEPLASLVTTFPVNKAAEQGKIQSAKSVKHVASPPEQQHQNLSLGGGHDSLAVPPSFPSFSSRTSSATLDRGMSFSNPATGGRTPFVLQQNGASGRMDDLNLVPASLDVPKDQTEPLVAKQLSEEKVRLRAGQMRDDSSSSGSCALAAQDAAGSGPAVPEEEAVAPYLFQGLWQRDDRGRGRMGAARIRGVKRTTPVAGTQEGLACTGDESSKKIKALRLHVADESLYPSMECMRLGGASDKGGGLVKVALSSFPAHIAEAIVNGSYGLESKASWLSLGMP